MRTIKVIGLNVEGVTVTTWGPGLDIPERINHNSFLQEAAEVDVEPCGSN